MMNMHDLLAFQLHSVLYSLFCWQQRLHGLHISTSSSPAWAMLSLPSPEWPSSWYGLLSSPPKPSLTITEFCFSLEFLFEPIFQLHIRHQQIARVAHWSWCFVDLGHLLGVSCAEERYNLPHSSSWRCKLALSNLSNLKLWFAVEDSVESLVVGHCYLLAPSYVCVEEAPTGPLAAWQFV